MAPNGRSQSLNGEPSSAGIAATAMKPAPTEKLDLGDIFYGRDQELLHLERIFRSTAAGRASKYPNSVMITGVSGSGKSTLVSKLREHLYTLEEEFFWISGKFEETQQQPGIDASWRDAANSSFQSSFHTSFSTSFSINASERSAHSASGSKAAHTPDTLHPFAAIVDAFSNFCQELEEEPGTLEEVRDDILAAIGQQGSLLTFMIPSLTKIIGDQVEAGHEIDNSAIQRFHFVFRSFIQALASQFRSLVLVLDDLHRADAASLDLLYSLLTSQTKRVMFIATYRSDEVDEHHRLMRWLKKLGEEQLVPEQAPKQSVASNNNTHLTTIDLLGMDLEKTNGFISELLKCTQNRSMALAHILHTKTNGNMFFLAQFLLSLTEEGHLWFDSNNQNWNWDDDIIRREVAVTTTLLDFMRDKMLCSEVAIKVLPLAAVLGARFSEATLAMVLTDLAKVPALRDVVAAPGTNIAQNLQLCKEEGFIQTSGSNNYQFVHDKVQEAALGLHPAETMQKLRIETGAILLGGLSKEQLEEKLFVVVGLLNGGMTDSVAPMELAQLNLKAAEKAKQLAAYSSAAMYVENALNAFPDQEKSDTVRAFSLEAWSLGAEIEAVLGQRERMEAYCQMVISSDMDYSVLETLRVQNVLIESIANMGGQIEAALKLCINLLDKLDCPLPKGSIAQVFRAVKSLLKSKAIKNIPRVEDLDKIGLMTNLAHVESMRLLDKVGTYAHMTGNPLLFAIVTTKAARMSVRYGICEKSPCALGALGITIMHIFGDYKAGTMYAELAISIVRRLQKPADEGGAAQGIALNPSESRATFVTHGMVLSWIRPLRQYGDELVQGYHAGMRAGDTDSACINTLLHIAIKFAKGEPLKIMDALCSEGVSQMIALQREETAAYTTVSWQCFLNLMYGSSTEGTTDLSGTVMHERDIISKEGKWAADQMHISHCHFKTILCTFFQEYEQGAKYAMEQGDRFLTESPGAPFGLMDPLFRGLCLYAAGSATKKSKYHRDAKKARGALRSWVKKGNPNAVCHLNLLDAEHEAYFGKPYAAKKLYDVACKSATGESFLHVAALAHQRFGEFLLKSPSQPDQEEATNQLMKATQFYQQWGAFAVANLLQEKHPNLKTCTSCKPLK